MSETDKVTNQAELPQSVVVMGKEVKTKNMAADTRPSTLNKMSESCRRFAQRLTRTKVIDTTVMDTNLRRCLSTADITLLGVGHMVGSGVYVLAATVAKTMAGPAIVLAFLLSGLASFLSALCYAELGVRYPKSGSAYSYTYLALGELWAFLVGWNVALENVIGVAAVARSCSAYVDSLTGGIIKNFTDSLVGPIHVQYLSERLDFLALIIVILFVIFLSFGVRMTSHLNNVFSVINISVIVLIIAVGAYFSDFSNWTNPDTGGFMPYGWSGVLAASASCFYAYVGFDSVATSGEEAKDPQKSIPVATMISMGIATVAYVGVSSVLTLMVNYKDITNDAGLPDALAYHGANWAKIIVIIGAVCGMATALIGSLFSLTRVVYAMADDGLLFRIFRIVNERTKIPLGAMYMFSCLGAILAFTLDIQSLVEVMSIGTLFAYLVVSASVIILRYRPAERNIGDSQELSSIGDSSVSAEGKSSIPDSPDSAEEYTGQLRERFYIIGSYMKFSPGRLVTLCVVVMVIFMFVLCVFVRLAQTALQQGSWWLMLILVILCLSVASSFVLILMHQQSTTPLRYKVPFVPFVPALSIFINVLLITNLRAATWLRLIIWVAIGMCLYFFYGVSHSKLNDGTLSPKSSLLCSGSNSAPTWGAFEKELTPSPTESKKPEEQKSTKAAAAVRSSSSQEILVDSMEK